RHGQDQQQIRDRAEYAVEPVEEVIHPLAVIAGDGAEQRAEKGASTAAARPTKIDVSDPLTVFFSTSRPHLSPPKGSVARRSSATTASPFPWPLRMSAITSASGSTLFSSSAAGAAGAAGAGDSAAGL